MRKYRIPQPARVRRIEKSFAWIDHRLLRNGYLEVMTHHDQALYLFLALVADRHGVSFYRKEKICDCLGLDWGDFEVGRDRLIDAGHIATLIKNGEHRPALVPGELAQTCRQLTRLRYAMTRQGIRIKQLLWSRLHPVWPEYEALFATPFCATGRKLLAATPTPHDLLAMDQQELTELIRKTSRGKYGPAQVAKIRKAAADSVGTRRGVDGVRIAIRSLLAQLEALQPIRKQLDDEIATLAERVPAYLHTLPGAGVRSVVSLFGETDPITTFSTPGQLVAFAGLDMTVFQTGQYNAPRRRISKRGSPVLRHTLWQMAHRACYQEGDLRDYWLRRRGEGLCHRSAVTATALKLCHVVWRILTDRRDYLPQRPNAKP